MVLFMFLLTSSCSDVKVNDAKFGNSLNKAINTKTLFTIEALINNSRIGDSKTETGYSSILYEDNNWVNWGDITLNLFGDRVVSPLYKTNKKEYEEIKNKIYGINKGIVDSIVSEWFSEKYYLHYIKNVQTAHSSKLVFVKNKKGYYNVKNLGTYEFYYSIMEKSNDPKIDSIIMNYTIKKFEYNCLIKEGKTLSNMKVKI